MKEFISKPADLLEDIWSDRDVNIVHKTHYLGKRKFDLIDICLNNSGQDEEQKYIRSGYYRQNIRIGNAIIENSKNKYCQFASKGLPKIFDIKLEHIQYFQKKNNLNKIQQNIAQIIFENVNKALHYGKRVELIKTQKINGENAQISYNYEYDSWVISHHNVSLLASCLEDLNIFKQERYHFTLIIAEHWLKQVKKLSKEKEADLKKLLDGFTAVGNFCGHSENEHIIQYNQPNIIWFAIVDNFSEEFALDPLKSKKELQKFNFTFAKTKSIVLTSSQDNFYSTLEKTYMKIAEASIEDSEFGMQGSVVYFVIAENQKNGIGRQKTIGAGKLKTLEYIFIQKIREKVSKSISKKQAKSSVIDKFAQQIERIEKIRSARPPYPHEYYFKILSSLLQLSEALSFSQNEFRKKFVALLKLIFYCSFKRISIKKFSSTMIEDESFMTKVKEIPFQKYGGLGCKTRLIYIALGLPGMFKSYLGQKISNHFQKINVPFEIISIQNTQKVEEQLFCLRKAQENPLQHFYLDGSFDSESLFKIVRFVHEKREPNIFYKLILIKDEIKSKFICEDRNEYPFSLETIVMCYYGQHQHKINSARLQQKIDNLKIVTQRLRSNANFNQAVEKLNLEQFFYPFSKQCKLKNSEEFTKIILDILKCDNEKNEFNLYGILILRLQQCEGIQYISEDLINTQIEHLIKASYPSIPIINFKK